MYDTVETGFCADWRQKGKCVNSRVRQSVSMFYKHPSLRSHWTGIIAHSSAIDTPMLGFTDC